MERSYNPVEHGINVTLNYVSERAVENYILRVKIQELENKLEELAKKDTDNKSVEQSK